MRELINQLSAFSAASQAGRLLRMDFPRDDGPSNLVLLVNTVHMREELSRDFRIEAELLSDDARIPLKAMMARMVTISMVCEDGSLRHMNGYVGAFQFLRTDGGFAYYHMVLQPWLAFARLRKDNVSFHHRSVLELTEATFSHYRQHDWKTRLSLDYGDNKLTCANQHNETDYNHLHRRWEDAGLYYHYEHRADGHTLVLSDNSMQSDSIGTLPFRAGAGSEEADGIRHWQAARQLGAGKVTLASFDYKNPRPQTVYGYSLNRQGSVEEYEVYENTGAYGYADLRAGELLAQRRMEEHDQQAQYFEAGGNHRAVQPGRIFRLDGHFSAEPRPPGQDGEPRPGIGARDYLILSAEHTASNNYPAGPQAKSEYSNTLTCIRRDIRWHATRGHNSAPCADPGLQTAIVTGPPGEDIHTDELGRIKLQFHWDRLGNFDQASSPWIRVMMPMAGQYFGQICLPRVGQEVVVQFLDGNVDHPIVVGVVYNRDHMPPWHLPAQRSLAGMRSRELGDANGGSNHLVLDDTKGSQQAQLKSDHQCSQLSLGSITRIDTSDGRQDARGEGWELFSNAWGVARANRGMLLTTEPRPDAASHITSMNETVQRLASAAGRQSALADSAQQYGAQDEPGQQAAVGKVLQQQAGEFTQPHLVLASPAGIEASTARSTHIASDEHTALTSGGNLSLAAGGGLFASMGDTFRLFVRKAGMKLVAASGKVSIRAREDDIEAVAKKVLSLISESDWVDIRGRKGVRLHGAVSMLEISDKVQFFTPSPTLFHGNLETRSPRNRPQPAEEPPVPPKPGELHSSIQGHGLGARYADVPYELYQDGAKIKEGLTDQWGRIVIAHQDGTPGYQIKLANGETFSLSVSPQFDGRQDEQNLSNLGQRALDDTTEGRRHD